MLAVRWYLRYGLSYRDVEELLAERGIEVDHVTVFRWVQRVTPLLRWQGRSRMSSPPSVRKVTCWLAAMPWDLSTSNSRRFGLVS